MVNPACFSTEPLNGCFEVLSVPTDRRSSGVLRTRVRSNFYWGINTDLTMFVLSGKRSSSRVVGGEIGVRSSSLDSLHGS